MGDETQKAMNAIEELKNWDFQTLVGSLLTPLANASEDYMNMKSTDSTLDLNFISKIQDLERQQGVLKSLEKKFGECIDESFWPEFLSGKEVVIPGGAKSIFGQKVCHFMSQNRTYTRDVLDYHNGLQLPESREFLIKSIVGLPDKFRSRKFEQNMYVKMAKGEFKIAGKFTYDDTFL